MTKEMSRADNLDENERKILDYIQRNPSMKGEESHIYKELGQETGLDSVEQWKTIISLNRKGIIRLSYQTSFNPSTKTSEDFLTIELSPRLNSRAQMKDEKKTSNLDRSDQRLNWQGSRPTKPRARTQRTKRRKLEELRKKQHYDMIEVKKKLGKVNEFNNYY